jgi:hypothetical protein
MMPMNPFVRQNIELRSDLSEWLVHFTKGPKGHPEAKLRSILGEKAIRSWQQPPVVCFTEAPLGQFTILFDKLLSRYDDPMLAPYGIAVRKQWLFLQGGRPAIYGLPKERDDLPQGMRWRHVTLSPACDFTWMREWRINTDYLELDPKDTLVVLPNDDAAWGLTHESGAEQEYDGPDEFITECWSWRDWYSFPLDQLEGIGGASDKVIAKCLDRQNLARRDEK